MPAIFATTLLPMASHAGGICVQFDSRVAHDLMQGVVSPGWSGIPLVRASRRRATARVTAELLVVVASCYWRSAGTSESRNSASPAPRTCWPATIGSSDAQFRPEWTTKQLECLDLTSTVAPTGDRMAEFSPHRPPTGNATAVRALGLRGLSWFNLHRSPKADAAARHDRSVQSPRPSSGPCNSNTYDSIIATLEASTPTARQRAMQPCK